MVDDFFGKQPQRIFEKDLKEYSIPVLKRCNESDNADFVRVNGIRIDKGVFAKEQLLETAFSHLERFISENGLNDCSFDLIFKNKEELSSESFEMDITDNSCVVFAGEIEGVRRAVIYFEDLLLSGGGFLKKGKISKKQVLELRLARCFFAPINRPPRNIAELNDDVDYYPDAYLDRLVYDGANAVWVYADLDQLIKSSYISEFGQGSERRIKKLNTVIKKCASFGIKVYLFTIAPMSLDEPTIKGRYPGIEKKYPQIYGNAWRGPKGFCTYSEFGEAYLSEAIENLIKSVPDLGGLISITFGERVTSCGNTWPDLEGVWGNTCPHCKDKTRMEIVTHTAKIIKDAIDRVNPNVDFISWTYGHRGQPLEVIGEYINRLQQNIVMLQNFEDDGRVFQLGKKRFALDYYLSYAGPSDMFKFTARRAVEQNKKIYAKMQVCCSHELATVPYIPVPGLIYDKFIGAEELGVTGIMESWLFGNYPCLMSKAVGLLSTEGGFSNKREFLLKLARLYWSGEDADKVATAWQFFEKGYTNYPVNVMFNYYGPMHDGVVWELSLIPKNKPLSRSWQLIDKPNGDRIGECLFEGHTIDEAITLVNELCKNWAKGLEILSTTSEWNKGFSEQISVAKALGVLFESGLNVLRFYKLRDALGYGLTDARATLAEMETIVKDEIVNSRKMIALCEADNRLGYHSEAEGYKFFPEKLSHRIGSLEKLLDEEFSVVKNRIAADKIPLEYYQGAQINAENSVFAGKGGLETAEWAYLNDNQSKFRIAVGEYIEIEIESTTQENFCFNNEYRLMFPDATMVVSHDGKLKPYIEAGHQSMLDEKVTDELSKWSVENLGNGSNTHLILRIKKSDTNFIRLPYKFLIRTYNDAVWCHDSDDPTYTLGKCMLSPGDFGWIK